MNNKFKKGSLALGTIATIAAPVAAVVSCGATANTINWKDSDQFGGVSGTQFLQEIKHLGKTKQNAITVGKEQMMQLQYESESIRSLMAQKDDFKYQNWQAEMEIAKLGSELDDNQIARDNYVKSITEHGTTDETEIKEKFKESSKVALKNYDDKLKSLKDSGSNKEDEIEKTTGFITKLDDVLSKIDTTPEFIVDVSTSDKNVHPVADFYKNDYESSDYPEVYKPLTAITEEKTAQYEDAHKNAYTQYNTRAEGEAAWVDQRSKSYGGAATKEAAISYLVAQEISGKAFNSYKFEITKSFTVEKKLWAQYIDKNAYRFLIEDTANKIAGSFHSSDIDEDVKTITGAGTADEIEENILLVNKGELISGKDIKASVLSSAELFIGSTSPDHRMPKDAYDSLGSVVKYQHLLIKATQGKTPEELWTVSADDIKKLMEFYQYSDDGTSTGTVQVGQGVDLLSSDKLFKNDDFTDFILGSISGNSAGTIKTQGSLGIKSEIEYLKEMVAGFSLGALSITEGETSQASVDNIDLSDLVKKLKAALIKEVEKEYTTGIISSVDKDSMTTANADIDAVITALGDDKVKVVFGQVFENFFKDKTKLVYRLGASTSTADPEIPNNLYLVISQFGIHIIKRTNYDDPDKISKALEDDLKAMAKDSSLTSSTSIVNELNSHYTETKILESLISPQDQKAFETAQATLTTAKTLEVTANAGTDETAKTTAQAAVESAQKALDALDSPYVKALKEKLDEYNKGKTDEVDKVTFEDINDAIDSINKLADKTAVDGAIGDKLENWLVTQLDAGLRTIGTTKLNDIYDWVQKSQEGSK